MGLSGKPKSVNVEGGQELEFVYDAGVAAGGKKEGGASILIIKDPGVAVSKDWVILVEI